MKESVVTNLQILAPSRKAPKVGDIFVCRPVGRGYFFWSRGGDRRHDRKYARLQLTIFFHN